MADDPVVYTSHARVERIRGPLRRVHLTYEDEPVYFGFHKEIAEYYGRDPADFDSHATTLDYVIAATGG